jgi:ADP-ribose pyrophosphatase
MRPYGGVKVSSFPNKSMEDFKVLKAEKIYSGRVVGLSRETIAFPDGKEAVREIVRHPGASAMVPMISPTEVILIKQFRYSAKKMLWEIPAGTLEPGETALACAERELVEEIGYRAGKMTPLGGFYTSPGFCNEFLHLFLATDLEPSQSNLDKDERLEVHRMPMKEALRKIETGDIIDAKTIAGLLKVSRMTGPT